MNHNAKKIEERTTSNILFLLAGLANDLTIEDFAFLIAYLESLGKSPSAVVLRKNLADHASFSIDLGQTLL